MVEGLSVSDVIDWADASTATMTRRTTQAERARDRTLQLRFISDLRREHAMGERETRRPSFDRSASVVARRGEGTTSATGERPQSVTVSCRAPLCCREANLSGEPRDESGYREGNRSPEINRSNRSDRSDRSSRSQTVRIVRIVRTVRKPFGSFGSFEPFANRSDRFEPFANRSDRFEPFANRSNVHRFRFGGTGMLT
jgi:hypothetical protein